VNGNHEEMRQPNTFVMRAQISVYVTACAPAQEKVAVVKFLWVWADAIPFSQEFL